MAETPARILAILGRRCATAWTVILSVGLLSTPLLGVTVGDQSDPGSVPAGDDRSAATETQIGNWIRQLNHDAYSIRQAAADRLLDSGFSARAALVEMADGPDPETRAAARRLVTLIDQTEFENRLAEFAADVDGRRGLTLPGWQEFGKLVGQDEAARKLFVAMYGQEASLIQRAIGNVAGDDDLRWEARIVQLNNHRGVGGDARFARLNIRVEPNPSPATDESMGSYATMFFLAAMPETAMSDTAEMLVGQLVQRPAVTAAMQDRSNNNALRRLVSAWILRCPSRNEQVLQMRLNFVFLFELREAISLALDVAGGDPRFLAITAPTRATAVQVIGRLGTEQHIAVLEPLLEDASEVAPVQPINPVAPTVQTVQIRDVALATLLHLTGQDPQDYGFSKIRRHPQFLFDVSSLGMSGEAERAAAIRRWRAWRTAHQAGTAPPS